MPARVFGSKNILVLAPAPGPKNGVSLFVHLLSAAVLSGPGAPARARNPKGLVEG